MSNLTLTVVFVTLLGWWYMHRRYVLKVTASGYIPTPSKLFIKVARPIGAFWGWLQIGEMKIVNPEYLKTPGRVIYCAAPHTTLLDAIVGFNSIPRPIRAMGAYEPMRKFWGIPGIVLTKLGAFAVDRSRGKTVIGPATEILVGGEPIFLCPEGKIEASGKFMPFKLGAAYIALAADKQLGGKEQIAFVPVHFCFGKRHAPSAFNYLRMLWRWRGGVTVTACKPIWLRELDNRDPAYITKLLEDALISIPCATTINPDKT